MPVSVDIFGLTWMVLPIAHVLQYLPFSRFRRNLWFPFFLIKANGALTETVKGTDTMGDFEEIISSMSILKGESPENGTTIDFDGCEEIRTSLAMKGESSQNDLIIDSNSAWKPKEIMSCIDFDKDMKGNINRTIESICKHASNVNTNPQQWKLVAKKTSESREVFKELCKALHDQEFQKNASGIENWIPLEEELLRILEAVEILIKDCCNDEWLMVAIKQGNMKETFAKFLHDIQWQMSLLCSILVSTSDVFEPTACDGNLLYTDRFNLLAAAKHD